MSTFKANAVLLNYLLEDVQAGKIQLPNFQRGWVWDDIRIRDLLISISRGFPIGAVMTLDVGGELQFQSRLIEGVASSGSNGKEQYLLDGQQRLTSLYQALRYERPVKTRNRPGGSRVIERWYYIDIAKSLDPLADRDETIISVPVDRVLRAQFGREVKLDLSSPEREFENHMIPTEKVMDGMAWGFDYANYWQKRGAHPTGDPFDFFTQFNTNILLNFSNYQVPVINLGKGPPKEAVCTVFEKVNTGGITLSVFELVTASFAADDFSLRDDWEARQARLRSAYGVLQGIRGDQFLQAVTLLATQARRNKAISEERPANETPGIDCRRSSMLDLKLKEYQEWADQVEAGFRNAAKFLHSQFIFTAGNVPYNTQLVPLATLYVELGKEAAPANAREKLARWFWCGVLGENYGSAVETQFSNDLAQVAVWVRGGAEPDLVTQAIFAPERLLSLRTRNSAAYKGMYALQMKSGAADWLSAESLAIADIHSKAIDIHHIFPKRWCEEAAKPPIPRRLYDSIINKTPIDAFTNRIIGGRAPSRYLPLLRRHIDSEKLRLTLEAHWIDPYQLEKDRFGECMVARGQAMLDLINLTLGKPTVDGREMFRDELISASPATEQYDDDDIEYDPMGDSAYSDGASVTEIEAVGIEVDDESLPQRDRDHQ